jgi:CheY-like chemotaxis protein
MTTAPTLRPFVLVADDEPSILDITTRTITHLGLVALPVENGAAALEAVERHHPHIRCGILDIVMPVLNGVDAAYAIQQIAPDLPLILMSGMFSHQHAQAIKRLHLVALLTKPFSLAEFRTIILQSADGSRGRQGQAMNQPNEESPGMQRVVSGNDLVASDAAEPWNGAAQRQTIHVIEQAEDVTPTSAQPHADGVQPGNTLLPNIISYAALESDFSSHHHTSAIRQRGPYTYYRLVYRYGYDLGIDPRFRSAEWASVEQFARPSWEERNPGTWNEFVEKIHYAWQKTRTA